MTLRTDKETEKNYLGRLATEDRVEELYIDAPTTLFNQNIQARPYRLLPIGTFYEAYQKTIEFLCINRNE